MIMMTLSSFTFTFIELMFYWSYTMYTRGYQKVLDITQTPVTHSSNNVLIVHRPKLWHGCIILTFTFGSPFLEMDFIPIHLNVWATPRKCTLGTFYRSETNKIDFYLKVWSRNHINLMKTHFINKSNHEHSCMLNIICHSMQGDKKKGKFW